MIHYGHLVLQNITIIIIFYQKVIIITRDRLERERERGRERRERERERDNK